MLNFNIHDNKPIKYRQKCYLGVPTLAEPFTKKGKLREGRDEEPWGRRLILQERMPGNGLHDKRGLKSASAQREPSNGER